MKQLAIFSLALTLTFPFAAQADQVITDDLIVRKAGAGGSTMLCLGGGCAENDAFNTTYDATLRLKGNNTRIEFEDNSGSTFPDADWFIQANETSGGFAGERFMIGQTAQNTRPFIIETGAPDDGFVMDGLGKVGLGTSLPQEELHLTGLGDVGIRLERTSSGSPYIWDVLGTNGVFAIRDASNNSLPFWIEGGLNTNALRITSDSNVGLGTSVPQGKLHTRGAGVQLAYFESSDGGPVQVRFRTDSENRRFLAVNNADEVKSQIIFGDNEIKFTGATDSGANLWLTISAAGIVSQGPTCGSPCDLTFDPDHFTVPPIAERAALMWDKMHLPAIGPTNPDTPINLTEKTGGIIHELEVAHIYIEQLHSKTEQQDEIIAQLIARLEDLEAKQ